MLTSKKIAVLKENDREFAAALAEKLNREGFKVFKEVSWDAAYAKIRTESPSLVLLNTKLSGISIFQAIKAIKALSESLIILLSDRESELDQILAFEIGADDFIVKPVNILMVMARIHAILRRTASARNTVNTRSVSIGNLSIDPTRREASLNGRLMDLTTIQFDLLWHLIINAGKIITRDDLCKAVGKSAYNGTDRSIDVYISRIRQKLGDDPSSPIYLKTVRGSGYLFSNITQ